MARKGKKGTQQQEHDDVMEEEEEVVVEEQLHEGDGDAADDDKVKTTHVAPGEETALEEVQERHRRELKDMKNKVQALKKQVTQGDKKKKKDIQTEIEALEAATTQRHQKEIVTFKEKHPVVSGSKEGHSSAAAEDGDEGDEDASEDLGRLNLGSAGGERKVSKAQKKKAKKEEKTNEIRRQAEEEAAMAPNLRAIEDEQIAKACTQFNLTVKQVLPAFALGFYYS